MTAREAIRWLDEKMHNVYSGEDKLEWLSQVEGMAWELAKRFQTQWEPEAMAPDTNLRIPAPYDQLYLRWLEAQVNYTSQEYLKYNNAMAQFNALWADYANWVCRNHLARKRGFRL